MAVSFDVRDFVKWQTVLADLDEQVAIFLGNLSYLKDNRFQNSALEARRQELLSQAVTLDGRVNQLQRALSAMREFIGRFRDTSDEQLAAIPLVPILGVVTLGGVIILVGQLTTMNQAITDYRQNVLEFVESGGELTDITPPNKTQQNIIALSILAAVVFGGFFFMRRK